MSILLNVSTSACRIDSPVHLSSLVPCFLFQLPTVLVDNKRLDGWVTEERIDFTQLQMPVKKEDKRSGNVGLKKARSRTLSMQKGTPNRKRKADDADGGDDDKVWLSLPHLAFYLDALMLGPCFPIGLGASILSLHVGMLVRVLSVRLVLVLL